IEIQIEFFGVQVTDNVLVRAVGINHARLVHRGLTLVQVKFESVVRILISYLKSGPIVHHSGNNVCLAVFFLLYTAAGNEQENARTKALKNPLSYFDILSHSTVTLFAKLRGLSTSVPRSLAAWYAKSCIGMLSTM